MPKLVSLLCYFIFVSLLSSFAQHPKMKFDSLMVDVGTIRMGHTIKGEFQFTNTGDAPLIIENVSSPSSDCAAEFSKEPVMPGKKAVIHFAISPSGNARKIRRSLVVISNTEPENTILKITGYATN